MPDPFQATTGRAAAAQAGEPASPGWPPPAHHQHKETVVALSLLCAILAVCLLFYCLDAHKTEHDTEWAKLPWEETTCSVKDIGVAYRGTCASDTSLLTGTESVDFAECLGPPDKNGNAEDRMAVKREWLRTPSGQCAEMGDADYRFASAKGQPGHGGALGGGGGGADLTSEEVALGGGDLALGRRLRFISPGSGRQRSCVSGYLPWAVVSVVNASVPAPSQQEEAFRGAPLRCAYQFGAQRPSITGDFDEMQAASGKIRESWASKRPIPCWRLASDDCVVAFGELGELVAAERAGGVLAGRLCGSFAVAAAVLALLAAALHWLDSAGAAAWCGRGYGHCLLPSCEDDEDAAALGGQLSDRVRGIVRSAAARLGEATPPSSGASTLRAGGSRRTIEISGVAGSQRAVPRNLAAEFLEGPGGTAPGGGWW